MAHGVAGLLPDGSVWIPRESYLATVALVRFANEREDPEEPLDVDCAQQIITTCEHFGMPKATYDEVDRWVQALRDGALEADDAE